MRTRGHHRTGAVALAGLALLAVGAGAPAQAAEQPQPTQDKPASQPSNEPSNQAEKAEPAAKPAPDVTAPARPALGEASTAPGGTIELPVQAESGSALVVREGAEVVASASALGVSQTLTWETKSGPHTYLVVATDAAGNVSDSASLTLEVDATPPAVGGFVVKPGTARDSRSRWGVVTDPGTAYELFVDGATIAEGTTETKVTRQHLDLADGDHEVRLELRDEAGNVRTVTETVDVEIPELWVAAKDVSADNATERSFKIASAPGTRGFLRIPGGGNAKFELPEGRAEVTVEVPEGSYAAPVVIVADSRDRKGAAKLAPFAVDLTAPALQVTTDEAAADRGLLSATITAGNGDTVGWQLVDDRGIAILSGQYVADGTEQRLDREIAEGSYDFEVTATDAMGNESTEKVTTSVTGRPLVNPDVMPALTITLVLWLLVSAAVFLRRRNRRKGALEGSEPAAGRGPRTKRGRQAAAQEALVEYERQVEAFRSEDLAWQQRRDLLAQLVTAAKGGEVQVLEDTLALRPQERALCDLPARLVEMQLRHEVEVPVEAEEGRLVITDARIVYAGTEHRDWELADLEQLRHVGQDRTLMKVTTGETVSGVAYGDADLVRSYFELATAEAGSRRSIRAMLEQGVRSHELRRPQPPAPVDGAPVEPQVEVAPVEQAELAEVAEIEVPQVAAPQAPQLVAQVDRDDRELLLQS